MKYPTAISNLSTTLPFVCERCVLGSARNTLSSNQYRPFCHYSTATNTPTSPSAGFTSLPSRRLISLVGTDSTHFLQGIITANISPTSARSSGFYTSLLNAQGRLLYDVFIYPQVENGKEGWLIEVDAREAEGLVKHVKRFKLRAKFDVRMIGDDEKTVWSLWKDGHQGWTAHGLYGRGSGFEERRGLIGCMDERAPGMGTRLILSGGTLPEFDAQRTSEDAYKVRRYLKGVPEGQDELVRDHALPQESNIDFMGGIDYRKGCYVGQELTIRTHHTGVVRKRILPVMLYGHDEAVPTALEYSPERQLGAERIPRDVGFGRVGKRGRSAGKWLAGVGNIGLGLCRLEIMTEIQVQGDVGGYREGDEFKLDLQLEHEHSGSGMVKIKAFVPPWHLTRH